MSSPVARALSLAAGGAVAGAICIVLSYSWHPALALEMDRDLPRQVASGLYPVERSGDLTFAWTSRRADIKLPGLNRRHAWTCAVRLRGARSDASTQPAVDVTVDGITAATVSATNDFHDVQVSLPVRDSAEGAVVSIASSRTIVPGPSDSRELGVQIDRAECRPAGGVLSFPPWQTVRDAALATAIFGVAFALVSATFPVAATATALVAIVQSLPLSAGPAPYIGFSGDMLWFALWIALTMVALVKLLERWRGSALENAATVAMMFSGAALYVKLLGLLHPSKLPVDAVFHAHRLEWVLDGRYFFTQPMPGGVTFPYAIGLYVFAAPWTLLTHDHVTLLRVIVCSAQAVAGALLYPVVVKAWGDRAAALSAVVLFNVVPLPYGLVGNANLTNTFGEAAALTAMLTASLLPSRQLLPVLAFFLVSALAFLSHVSTFALLGVTLVILAVLYRVLGGAAERRLAWSIGVVTIVSAVLAVALYYGHFGDVYKNALRVRADATPAQSQTQPATTPAPAPGQSPSLGTRLANAMGFAVGMIGWPILLLAIVGAWRSVVDRSYDRATLAMMAWTIACAVFLAVAVMRVDAPFQRYASEFFGRVLLATFPAAVLLAARATGWAWKHGVPLRLASALLAACAVTLGIQNWMAWFL